jgi:hypothetical protein
VVDPLTLGLTVAAGAVAMALGWLELPRPPDLDGERWFKVTLATLLRGRLDRDGATPEQWEALVTAVVPYHPAGRLPERKISNPTAASLPGAALPGERALLDALAARSTPEERLTWLYDADPIAVEARTVDPSDLGPDYDYRRLGPAATWDALAAWEPAFAELARKGLDWVLLDGRPDHRVGPPVMDALAAELPGALRVPHGAEDLLARIQARLTDPTVRVVLIAEEAAATDLLRALLEDAAVRDQVAAVVAIGGVVGGRTDEAGPYGEALCKDWLQAHFGHRDLDTDVVRRTPYFAVQWLDRTAWPPGVPGLPLQAARFPEPSEEGATAATVEVVDLGPLWVDRAPPPEVVARALVAVVAAWVRSRR